MKHTSCILPIVMILILATLTGCSGTGAEPQSATPATALDTSYPDALPVMNQLALGTLQLEWTDAAATAEQAAKLLPLWQALRGVLSSQNLAQAEIDAVLKQIESGMTADQIAAIREMQLTQTDLVEWARENGVNFGSPFGAGGDDQGGPGQGGGFGDLRATIQAGGEIPPELQATIEAQRTQGGGGFGPGGTISPEARATFQAQGGPGGFRGADLPIVDRLIGMLEARSGE